LKNALRRCTSIRLTWNRESEGHTVLTHEVQEKEPVMKVKTVKLSNSYHLLLPESVCEQSDERVSSFWLDGKPLLLQLSSYVREKGRQLGARTRLEDRIAKQTQKWNYRNAKIHPGSAVDQATAEFTDENGILWVHSYFVWPHLTIYATISGLEELVRDEDNWAIQGLKSIKLVAH
jgi:hypothetical protein